MTYFYDSKIISSTEEGFVRFKKFVADNQLSEYFEHIFYHGH